MIEQLKTHAITDNYGDNCYGISYPSKSTVFDKLNEIIDEINSIKEDIIKLKQKFNEQ